LFHFFTNLSPLLQTYKVVKEDLARGNEGNAKVQNLDTRVRIQAQGLAQKTQHKFEYIETHIFKNGDIINFSIYISETSIKKIILFIFLSNQRHPCSLGLMYCIVPSK
jgi:hypothetical protein